MIAYFLSLKDDTPCRGYWDYGLLEDLLKNFTKKKVRQLQKEEFAIVVIPARSHADVVKKINKELSKIDAVLLFLMGDEENDFHVEKIKHPNIKIWVQNPHPSRHSKYEKLGCGYPPLINNVKNYVEKSRDWFFAGQITHERRELCIERLKTMKNGYLHESPGFTQGIDQKEYYQKMASAKTCPCPSGPQTVDTFRLFEALELGCVPIADSQTSKEDWVGFWEWLFGEPVPFPIIKDYDSLPGYTNDCIENYPIINNKIQAWWLRYKHNLKNKIYENIEQLTSVNHQDQITVVIPISPIPSHPKIHILEETINSVKHHLPNSQIILSFDGVRKELEEKRDKYNEHIQRVLWKSRFWGNIKPFIFDEHKHQSGMLKALIDQVNSPLLLFVEQDTPLVTDEKIEWEFLKDKILSGQSNIIRLHHEAKILKEHKHLMIGNVEDRLLKTVQWSQRPHLASVAFYRRIMNENFSEKSNCFIEDLIHGKLIEAFLRDGRLGWEQWRVHIYHPNSINIKRSYHTDGRAGDQKFDTSQVW